MIERLLRRTAGEVRVRVTGCTSATLLGEELPAGEPQPGAER